MKYNCEVQPGDILLTAPSSVIGRMISWFSGPYSHVGQVLKFGGRVWVIDANPPAVRIMPLSSWIKQYRSVCVKRPLAAESYKQIERGLEKFLFPQIGVREYAESTVARLAVRLPLGWIPKNDSTAPLAPVICSELVAETAISVYGFDPCPDAADRWTTPSDLAKSGKYFTVQENLKINEA